MTLTRIRVRLPDQSLLGEISTAHPDAVVRVLTDSFPGKGCVLVSVLDSDPEAVRETIDGSDLSIETAVISGSKESMLLRVRPIGSILTDGTSRCDIPIDPPYRVRDGWLITDVEANVVGLARLEERFDRAGIDYQLRTVGDHEDTLLTERQQEVIETAIRLGYYDVPRRCTLTDLAEAVGIAKSSCSETLHRAESTLITDRFGDSRSPMDTDTVEKNG